MVETSMFGEVAGRFSGLVFSGILWFGLSVFLIGVVGFFVWWFGFYRKKFDITVKIISERAGDKNKIIFDKAAILIDRTDKSSYFRLWNQKINLPAPRFNVLQSTTKGDYLELYRTSENSFSFLTPNQIDKTKIIESDGNVYSIASQKSKQINPNMEFWNMKRKSNNKRMFDPEHPLMKLLPFLPHILTGAIMIFILYILMDSLPAILSELTRLTSELKALKGADVITGLSWILI